MNAIDDVPRVFMNTRPDAPTTTADVRYTYFKVGHPGAIVPPSVDRDRGNREYFQ
jgi:hypothetical protein